MKLRQGSLVALIGLLALAVTAPARAQDVIPLESPDYFVTAFGYYDFNSVAAGSEDVGGSQITFFPYETSSWRAGGMLTLPIWRQLGTRLGVSGGQGRLTSQIIDLERTDVSGGFEIFWRDPTIAEFSLGYVYGWARPKPQVADQSLVTHTIPLSAALFMPDIQGGVTDWRIFFDYTWIEMRDLGTTVNQWQYDVGGMSTWYVNDFVAFDAGVLFSKLIGPGESNLVEGIFALEFLVPSGALHYGTLRVYGGVGRVAEEDLPDPFSTVTQSSWRVGVLASVHFPGVRSLVELNRAYR